ncbi:MAG: Do family serine endopeptidase [Robiginitomaculum sp.]
MKSSLLLGAVGAVITSALIASPLIAPPAQAQASWPVFSTKAKAKSGQALSVDPQRGVLTMAPLLERTTPAVVNITVSSKVKALSRPSFGGNKEFFEKFFGDNPGFSQRPKSNDDDSEEYFTRGAGSGVIINAGKGYILTNHHVVAGADTIKVFLKDGRVAKATLVGSDAGTDIALIKVDLENMTDLTLADSDTVKVGDYVIAIGNPFGIGQTVTSGIVSALGRTTSRGDKYQDYIQTDAAINKGNSGGALINSKGDLIGINSAIMSRSGGSNGIGFAVPANMVTGIIDQLISYGEVHRGRIGVSIQNITPELQEAMRLPTRKGALVGQVQENSPAEKAGLKVGDIITKFNGVDILDSDDIRNAVGVVERGHKAKISYLRDGKKYTVHIGVEKIDKDDAPVASDKPTKQDVAEFDALGGAKLGNIPTGADITGGMDGVFLISVKRGSYAWEAGLKKGDIIRAVNTLKIKDLEGFKDAMKGKKKAVALTVQRGRSQLFIAVK